MKGLSARPALYRQKEEEEAESELLGTVYAVRYRLIPIVGASIFEPQKHIYLIFCNIKHW